MKSHFHVNGIALSLALKQRLGAARKWPIVLQEKKCLFPTLSSHLVANRGLCSPEKRDWVFNMNDQLTTFPLKI